MIETKTHVQMTEAEATAAIVEASAEEGGPGGALVPCTEGMELMEAAVAVPTTGAAVTVTWRKTTTPLVSAVLFRISIKELSWIEDRSLEAMVLGF